MALWKKNEDQKPPLSLVLEHTDLASRIQQLRLATSKDNGISLDVAPTVDLTGSSLTGSTPLPSLALVGGQVEEVELDEQTKAKLDIKGHGIRFLNQKFDLPIVPMNLVPEQVVEIINEKSDGFVGVFNEGMHAKIIDCDQGAESRKMPWVNTPNIGKSTATRCNAIMLSMRSGDVSLMATGSKKDNRDGINKLTDDCKEEDNQPRVKTLENFFVYSHGAPGIRFKGLGGLGEVEPFFVGTYHKDPHPCRIKRVQRRNKKGTSNQLAIQGMARKHHKDLHQVSPADKQQILDWLKNGVDVSTKQGSEVKEKVRTKKSFKAVKDSLPLTWRSKHEECWCEALPSVKAARVTDVLPGDFAAAKACVVLGIPYIGLCYNEAHVAYGKEVVLQAIIRQMADKNSWCYVGEDIAKAIETHFPKPKETPIEDMNAADDESSGSDD